MNSILIVTIIGFLHILALALTRFFPYPELFVYPYLAENGLLPYKQIFDQHFPSFLMMPFNFYDLGLRSELSSQLYLLGIVFLTHLLIFLVTKEIFKTRKLIFLPNAFYFLIQPLFEGNFLWLDTFLAPILLLSFYFSLRFLKTKSVRDAFFCGILLGFCLFLKQIMFPLVFLVILFLYWKTKAVKPIILMVFGSLIPLALTLGFIYSKGILGEFIYWTFTFNFDVYAKMGRKLPSLSQFIRFSIFWFPTLYWLALKKKTVNLFLLFIFTLFPLLNAASRFEFVHLQPSLPFMVLAVYAIFLSYGISRNWFILLLLIALTFWWPLNLKRNLLRPSYLFTPEVYQVANMVNALTTKNEKIFVLGTQPIVYTLSDRLPAGAVFTVNVPWNVKVSQDLIHKALIGNPPKVVIRDKLASIDGQKVVDFSPKLNSFIDEKYQLVANFGTNEILIQK